MDELIAFDPNAMSYRWWRIWRYRVARLHSLPEQANYWSRIAALAQVEHVCYMALERRQLA